LDKQFLIESLTKNCRSSKLVSEIVSLSGKLETVTLTFL